MAGPARARINLDCMRALPWLLVLLAVAGCGADDRAVERASQDPQKHFAQITEEPEVDLGPDGRYLVARLERRTWLRTRPGGRQIRRLNTHTEFGSPNILGVVERRDGWLRVITPRLPNRRTGWIPEADARLNGTDFSLHVDRSARRVTLRRDGRTIHRATIAVGRPGNETPLGRFAVTDKLRPRDGASPYGCCAIALSGHQTRLEPGWPGGDRLAIHGTPATWSIGKAVSLGCMRAHAEDLQLLMSRVPLGAPVFITA
jgi:hypothetical protein